MNCIEQAKELAPAIIFIDEIDAVACSRKKVSTNSYDRQTINQILTEMDG